MIPGPLEPVTITRDPGLLTVAGIRAGTLAALRQALAQYALAATPIAADLSCGAWQSHQVAQEFCAQLHLERPRQVPFVPAAPPGNQPPPSHGELVGTRIDAETRGDRTILEALALATRVVQASATHPPLAFVIVMPRYHLPWEAENLLFVRFLVQGLRDTPHQVRVIAADAQDPPVPDGWQIHWLNEAPPPVELGRPSLLHLVPGVADAALAGTIDPTPVGDRTDVWPLAAGHFLLAPECRRNPQEVSPLVYDHLAAMAALPEWLRAYAQCYGDDPYVDAAFLSAVAKQRFAEGGTGIALRLLDRAIAAAPDPVARATYQAQSQGMLITLTQHAQLAAMPDPEPGVWPQLRAILLEGKGWGLTMLNAADRAQPYLEESRRLFDQQHYPREYLYLLNISALSRLRAGDVPAAQALEHEIETTLAQQPQRDPHLEYINSLNTARLYRRTKAFAESERYYQQAFATALGLRSANDALYANASLARLYMDQGAQRAALYCWLRASLYWLAHSVPESVGARVAGAIVNRGVAATESTTEAISGALLALLRETAQAAALPEQDALVARDGAILPVYCRSEAVVAPDDVRRFECAVGSDGWSVLTTTITRPVPFRGPQYDRLRAALYALLQALAPVPELANQTTLVIDDNLGQEMAVNQLELLATCLRLDVPQLIFAQETVVVTPELRSELEDRLLVQLGSAVARREVGAETVQVWFKRYQPPLTFTGDAAHLLAALDDPSTLKALAQRLPTDASAATILGLARSLEQARVLNLYLPENALCIITAGIK